MGFHDIMVPTVPYKFCVALFTPWLMGFEVRLWEMTRLRGNPEVLSVSLCHVMTQEVGYL